MPFVEENKQMFKRNVTHSHRDVSFISANTLSQPVFFFVAISRVSNIIHNFIASSASHIVATIVFPLYIFEIQILDTRILFYLLFTLPSHLPCHTFICHIWTAIKSVIMASSFYIQRTHTYYTTMTSICIYTTPLRCLCPNFAAPPTPFIPPSLFGQIILCHFTVLKKKIVPLNRIWVMEPCALFRCSPALFLMDSQSSHILWSMHAKYFRYAWNM